MREPLIWRSLAGLLLSLFVSSAFAAPPDKPKPAPTKVVARGSVVDDKGKPVAGAIVRFVAMVKFRQATGTMSSGGPIPHSRTDERGAFTVELPAALTKDVTLFLCAQRENAFTARALELHGDDLEKPITLTISPRNARALRVRVVDDESKPIAGAAVVVHHRPSGPPLFVQRENKPVELPKDARRTTDRTGCLKTPACLAPDGFYQIELSAEGFFTDRTPWKELAAEETGFEARLRRLQPLQGQIRDRQGKPVAGARVARSDGRQKVETVTDKDGHFQLKSAFFAPGFLFVSKSGFRFHGQRCDRPEALKIVLIRRDESQPQKMTTLPPALPRAQRKELAARLLGPIVQRVRQKDDNTRLRPLQSLGRLDPGRLLAELDSRPMQDAWYESYARRAAVQGLKDEAPQEARTIIESMKQPDSRSVAYLDLCDALPEAKNAEKRALLHDALLHARGIQASDLRILRFAAAARRLWTLGDKQLATKLLREGQEIARELPNAGWSAYARSAFAEDLALIDLESALALMKDQKEHREFVRHHGNLAYKLAGTDPAAAERVFGILLKGTDVQSAFQRDQYAVMICQRMVSVDRARAEKIAEAVVDPHYKARTYSLMAQSLARSQPREALALLDRAFEFLEKHVASGKDSFDNFSDAASLAVLMLPSAEEIDPSLVPEFFWRALSQRSPPRAGVEDDWNLSRQTDALGALALVLARYDRKLALAFVEEARKRTPNMQYNRLPHLRAAALADPRQAVVLIEALPVDARTDYWRLNVVNMLLAEGDAAWKIMHEALAQWFVGDEESL